MKVARREVPGEGVNNISPEGTTEAAAQSGQGFTRAVITKQNKIGGRKPPIVFF
jgi:hypothetical protein